MSSIATEDPLAKCAVPTGSTAHYSVFGCVNIGRAIYRSV
jgi:hypothetical protein